ncbi:MAG: LamG domain-containing protein [Planctomycetia bacterium]|jgi:hypothetical protein
MKLFTKTMALLIVAAVAVPTTAAPYLQDNLISVWSFDETTGSTAYDSGGVNNNNATFTPGMALTGSGFSSTDGMTGMGNYVQFNGDWDSISGTGTETAADIGVQPSLQVSDQFTISMWMRFDKLAVDYNETFIGLFDSQADDYVLMFEKSGRVRTKAVDVSGTAFRWGSSFDFETLVTDSVNNNTWVHVVTTYDSTGTYNGLTVGRMYVNGAEVATALLENTIMNNIRTGQHLSIGGTLRNNSDPTFYYGAFNGGIDEVAVWGRALAADEVSYLYNGGDGVPVLAANPESSGTFVDPFGGVDSANPIIHYQFEGNLENSGLYGFFGDGSNDGPGTNLSYETSGGFPILGQYLKLNNGDSIMTGGDRVVIPNPVSYLESGTIAFWLREDQSYNYNTIFNCSEDANDWEMWIYGDDPARADRYKARIDSGSVYVNPDPEEPNGNENGFGGLGEWNHYAFRWVKEENGIECNYQLFLNGVLVDTRNDLWSESGSYFFLGGGDGNEYGTFSMDDFRLYDVCLSESAITDLVVRIVPTVPEPGTFALLLGLGALVLLRRRKK